MAKMDRDFFEKYHRAVVLTLGDDVTKATVRIGGQLAQEWLNKLANQRMSKEQFLTEYQNFLQNQLKFAKEVKVKEKEGGLEVVIRGCHLCHGNELLRQEQNPTSCPICRMNNSAIAKTLGKQSILEEIKKTGVVGECNQHYRIND